MKTFNNWLDAKQFTDADFVGETGPMHTYRIRYAYKTKDGAKMYQAWGFGSGTSPHDAGDAFGEFLMDENGYPEVKILQVQRVTGASATDPNNPNKAAGLTNKTPTNQKLTTDKYKTL